MENLIRNCMIIVLNELTSFNTGEPSSYDSNPPIERILSLFESNLEEMREFIKNLSVEQLNSPIPHHNSIPPFIKNTPVIKILAEFMANALTHLGQAIEVRRMLNKDIEGIN
ncbi:MAG: hypothetical protein ACFE9L_03200 [Candidatus Hodarchaeota archaeon]